MTGIIAFFAVMLVGIVILEYALIVQFIRDQWKKWCM